MEQKNTTNWLGFSLIVIFLTAVVVVLSFLYFNSNKKDTSVKTAKKTVQPEARVVITQDKFNPEEITIKAGTTLTWVNEDNVVHQIASDPHPTHDKLKNLGSGEVLSKGDSVSYTFEKTGKFTYHDHLNPLKLKGAVVVE